VPQEIFRQTNFNGGELSPKAVGRRDLEAYVSSLALCENMQVMAEGPIRRRGGLRHVDLIRNRLLPLEVDAVTVTAPNGGDGENVLDGSVLVTTTEIGTADPYVIAEFDFGAPVEVALVDLLNYAILPGGTGGGGGGVPPADPAPPQYPWDRPELTNIP